MTVLLVLAGGMTGAPARYVADRMVQARHDSVFPWGTFAVNVAGSALLGFLLGAQRHLGLPPAVMALVGTGFCGGLTTYSTFGYETLRLLEDGALGEAGLSVIGSLAVGVGAAWLGFLLAGALLPVSPGLPRLGRSVITRKVDCRGSTAFCQPAALAGAAGIVPRAGTA